jgi:hypothetical protein
MQAAIGDDHSAFLFDLDSFADHSVHADSVDSGAQAVIRREPDAIRYQNSYFVCVGIM